MLTPCPTLSRLCYVSLNATEYAKVVVIPDRCIINMLATLALLVLSSVRVWTSSWDHPLTMSQHETE